MALEDFIPAQGNTFRIDSGKLLIADPFCLGLQKDRPLWEILDSLPAAKELVFERADVAIRVMQHGAILENGYEIPWHIYQEKDSLLLIPEIDDLPKNRNEIKRRKGTSILEVYADVCRLLVGDAEKFIVAPEKRQQKYDFTKEPFNTWDEETREMMTQMDAEETESVIQQVINIPAGDYTVKAYNNPQRFLMTRV